MDEDTSRVTCAGPRDSVEQGVHLSPEEDTAKPVVSARVAIFPKNTNFITKMCAGLLETDDDNVINLDLDANTIFQDRIYIKQWKDPVKEDARNIKVNVKCYSIEFNGKLCSGTTDER